MWLCYAIALFPAFVGLILWITRKEIVWYEWLASIVVGFGVSALFHVSIIVGMTSDVETWSGHIYKTMYYPEWVEKYHVTHRVKDKKGNTIRTYTTTHYRTHDPYWEAYHNFGKEARTVNISQERYKEIKREFGDKVESERASKSGFYSGDHNVYTVNNKTNKMLPVTMWMSFENRVKAAPSVFSYPKVSEKEPVFNYPENKNYEVSDRLLGIARKAINIYLWDCMNTKLGPTKKVNVIMIGFPSATDSSVAGLQEAKFIGGKKNDLVLCYSGDVGKKTEWARVFGWTEEEMVKRNLETIMIKNIVSNDMISMIEREIITNYKIKDWSKFDYITVEPPAYTYIILIVLMVITQSAVYFFAVRNNVSKVLK